MHAEVTGISNIPYGTPTYLNDGLLHGELKRFRYLSFQHPHQLELI